MISDPNGGGLTRAVVNKLAARLREQYQVTATVDEYGDILAARVTGPGGDQGNIRVCPTASGSSVEWWTPYDPNGSPTAWTSYDPVHSDGVDEAVMIIVGWYRAGGRYPS